MTDSKKCPCNSGKLYAACCEAVLSGQTVAATAEALMRSRYSAYVCGNSSYLLKTWHPSTRPVSIDAETIPNWCGLEILRTEQGQKDDIAGIVEFKATALSHDKMVVLHESSHFVKEEGQWFYVSGDISENSPFAGQKTNKIGRNCQCPCGSGKKFKKCCGH